jgi:hypothetical protein
LKCLVEALVFERFIVVLLPRYQSEEQLLQRVIHALPSIFHRSLM